MRFKKGDMVITLNDVFIKKKLHYRKNMEFNVIGYHNMSYDEKIEHLLPKEFKGRQLVLLEYNGTYHDLPEDLLAEK